MGNDGWKKLGELFDSRKLWKAPKKPNFYEVAAATSTASGTLYMYNWWSKKPKDEPKDEHKDKPKDEPKDKPKDKPKDEPKDKPKDEPKDKPKTDFAKSARVAQLEVEVKMLERDLTELKQKCEENRCDSYVETKRLIKANKPCLTTTYFFRFNLFATNGKWRKYII